MASLFGNRIQNGIIEKTFSQVKVTYIQDAQLISQLSFLLPVFVILKLVHVICNPYGLIHAFNHSNLNTTFVVVSILYIRLCDTVLKRLVFVTD